MPGFNMAIGNYAFRKRHFDSCKIEFDSIDEREYGIQKFTLKKFENDKLFVNTDRFKLVLEGVILNKKDLINSDQTWEEAVLKLYVDKGDNFFSCFRGSFSGALYDKDLKKWIIFTDHIGSKHIYYYRVGNHIYCSSEISDMYAFFKENSINFSLDEQAAYMLLSFGYMLDDFTLCAQIKKLNPGCYIKLENDSFSIHQYYKLPESFDENISEEIAIEKIDELFRKAIILQFEKDREYGYKHFVALSGGLDSRMTSFVAHELGYTNQVNFTFSQSGYLDETIAKKIAADLKHEWIFKALDNGNFLNDIDEINYCSGGNILYYGLAHGNSALKLISFNNFGISHSGQLGDVVISTFGLGNVNENSNPYSSKLLNKVKSTSKEFYSSLELKNMYQRGFNGANTGLLAIQNYTETISPFYDVDLMDYCFRIPIDLRNNHKLYKKWIIKKYPDAANYIWEKTGQKITSPTYKIRGHELSIVQLINIFLLKMRLTKQASETPLHMNPLGYWYKTNPQLKIFQDNYFDENINRFNDHSQIKIDCTNLYRNGTGIEKNQALTLLSALKLFFQY